MQTPERYVMKMKEKMTAMQKISERKDLINKAVSEDQLG